MNRFWGDDSWRKIAWVESPQQSLFGYPPDLIKQDNDTTAEAFRDRLARSQDLRMCPNHCR
jgi:hypothetical protein